MKKKGLIFFLAVLLLTFSFGFSKEFFVPKAKNWIRLKINNYSKDHLPVTIAFSDIQFNGWPIGITFTDVKIKPKATSNLSQVLAPIKVKQTVVTINFSNLLTSEVRPLSLLLDQLEVTTIIKKKNLKTEEEQNFSADNIFSLPLKHVVLKNSVIQTHIVEKDLLMRSENTLLSTEITQNQILTVFNTPKVTFKKKGQINKINMAVNTRFSVSPERIKVSALRAQKGQSLFLASGLLTGEILKGQIEKSDLQTRSLINLSETTNWLNETLPELNIPSLSGDLQLDAKVNKTDKQSLTTVLDLKINEAKYSKYRLGVIRAKGTTDLKKLNLESLIIDHPAGQVSANKGTLQYSDYSVSLNILTQQLSIQPLLKALNVDAPVEFGMSASLPCKGVLTPSFILNCDGSAKAKNIHIYNERPKGNETIVKIPHFDASGKLSITEDKVSYSADLQSYSESKNKSDLSTGKSKGVIDYEKGFDIFFESPSLNLSNIKNLIDLKLEGSTEIKGQTKGNSRTATLNTQVRTKDFWFENFNLGDLNSQVSYKKGLLTFDNIVGKLKDTQYQGELSVDVLNEQIAASLNFPILDIENVQKATQRVLPLPIDFKGSGSATIELSGPLIINQLTYQLDLQLFRGQIAFEQFEKFLLSLNSKTGRVRIETAQLIKDQKKIEIFGHGWPDGRVLFSTKVSDFPIQSLDIVKNLKLNTEGFLSFESQVEGTVHSPLLKLSGQASQVTISNKKTKDSLFDLKLSDDFFQFKGKIFGDSLTTSFNIPLNKKLSFESEIIANNFVFSPLFGLLQSGSFQDDYYGKVNANISLKSAPGTPFNPTGFINISQLKVQKSNLSLTNEKPIYIKVNQGAINDAELSLAGSQNFIKLKTSQFSPTNLNSQITGNLDAAFFSFLFPFIEGLQGDISFSLKSSGSIKKPSFIGSAFWENGSMLVPPIPHPFERIKADLLFSQSKLIINSFSSQLTTGSVFADGSIDFQGFKQLQTQLNLRSENIKIDYPENVSSVSSGDLKLEGSWFPFLLSGKIDLTSMDIKQEFTEKKKTKTNIQESPLLPEQLTKTESKIVNLQIDVNASNGINITNSIIATSLAGNVNVTGNLTAPQIEGTLNGNSGTLFFRETPFDISQATVNFLGKKKSNPSLFFEADTRVEEFDIFFLLQGNANNPKISLTSQPTLPEQEIISLLALGLTSESNLSDYGSEQQATSTALIGLSQGISKEFKDKFGLNLKVTQDINETNQDQKTAVQKITISKELFSRFEGSLSSAIGDSSAYDVRLQYKFNKNLSLIGSWENNNTVTAEVTDDETDIGSTIGLDVELKFEFN